MAVPKKKTSKAKSRSRRASAWRLDAPPRSDCPQLPPAKLPHVVCAQLRLVRRPPGHRGRLRNPSPPRRLPVMLPIAVDAMGGDTPPGEIVAGARQAAAELGVPVVLVGRPDGDAATPPTWRCIAATEVIEMNDDPRPGACAARRTRRWCGPPRRCATAGPRPW